MAEIMVQTCHLTKRYGALCAVNDVSLTIEKGAIVGLVGKNGAGKTTLIRLLTGLINPSNGKFSVLPERKRTSTSVSAMIERPSLYEGMTAIENLHTQCILLNVPTDEAYLEKTLSLVGLYDKKKKVKDFSYGMKQRLAVAMALVGKPDLLLLDEPTNGLDPEGIHCLRELFVALNKDMGTTIVVSSHILAELQKYVTEFYIMDKGRIVKHVSAKDFATNKKRLRISVDNVQAAQEVLSSLGETIVCENDVVEVLGDIQPTQALLVLSQNGIVATDIVSVEDSLEDYFIKVVRGAR